MLRVVSAALLFLVLLPARIYAEGPTPAMEAAFLDKVKAAFAKKDYAAFSTLVCHDGTLGPALRSMVDKSNHQSFDMVASHRPLEFAFIPVPANQVTSFEFQGKAYEINLKPVDLLQVKFADVPSGNGLQSVQFPLGLKANNLMVATTKEKGT